MEGELRKSSGSCRGFIYGDYGKCRYEFLVELWKNQSCSRVAFAPKIWQHEYLREMSTDFRNPQAWFWVSAPAIMCYGNLKLVNYQFFWVCLIICAMGILSTYFSACGGVYIRYWWWITWSTPEQELNANRGTESHTLSRKDSAVRALRGRWVTWSQKLGLSRRNMNQLDNPVENQHQEANHKLIKEMKMISYFSPMRWGWGGGEINLLGVGL